MSDSPPSRAKRAIAIVLAMLCPPGTGQFFLGARTRGFVWLAACVFGAIAGFACVPWAVMHHGFVFACIVPFAVPFVLWVGSVIDLAVYPSSRFGSAPVAQVIGFVALGFATTVVIPVVVRVAVMEAFRIPGESMLPTFASGDEVFVDKRATSIDYGDVIVFVHPEKPEYDYVARVVALPGDLLETPNGRPAINGWAVPHCAVSLSATQGKFTGELDVEFLGRSAYLVLYDGAHVAPETPPLTATGFLVLGDNRNASVDSRVWFQGAGGSVPAANVRGRALFYWTRSSRALGTQVGGVHLPSSLAPLQPNVDRCLRDWPAIEATTPPHK